MFSLILPRMMLNLKTGVAPIKSWLSKNPAFKAQTLGYRARLFHACWSGDKETFEEVVRHGQDIHSTRNDGRNLMDLMASRGSDPEVLQYLKDMGLGNRLTAREAKDELISLRSDAPMR